VETRARDNANHDSINVHGSVRDAAAADVSSAELSSAQLTPADPDEGLRPLLVGMILASGIVGRVAELLSLLDAPMRTELTRPIPQHVMQV
jgi:hypothetical protein